ncbi:MAG: DUF3784 domain-containing protein [Thermoplasmata archaeon]|nr:DUF3784 domain-containing protein [Thermoplasmata archaeon]
MSIFYERRRGVSAMCIVWAIVAVIAAFMLIREQEPYTVIALVVSAVFLAIAVVTYLGHYGFMSGFSTMSLEELNRFDIEAVTSSTGICMFATSLLSFASYAVASLVSVPSTAMMVAAIVVVVMLVAWVVWISFSSRFRNGDVA